MKLRTLSLLTNVPLKMFLVGGAHRIKLLLLEGPDQMCFLIAERKDCPLLSNWITTIYLDEVYKCHTGIILRI